MHTITRGIVLRETAYKDADKILTVLTADHGKLTVKARGCRRKGSHLAAAAQLLVWSELTLFQHRDYYTVNQAQSLEQFWQVKSDVDKLALGSYFAEVADCVATENEPDPALLSLLLNSLYALDKLEKSPALVKAAFELRVMELSGFAPLAEGCAVCGAEEPKDPALNLSQGLLHCAGCRHGVSGGLSLPLRPAALAALRYVLYGSEKRLFSFSLDEESLVQLGQVSEAYLMTQLERGFRTLDFYKGLHMED